MKKSKRIKYIGINLTKDVRDQFNKNYKILMKEIEEDTKNRKISSVHGLEELIFLKYPYYPAIYRFEVIPMKIPKAFFTETEKNQKFVRKHKDPL